MDYYHVLGVKPSDGADTIKAAYRKLAKQYHPDANPGSQTAARKFEEIAEAYAVLGDPEKRKNYDETEKKIKEERQKAAPGRSSGQTMTGMAGADFQNMSATFEQFFGFPPGGVKTGEKKQNATKNTKTNPMDMSELFERYMGIKKQ